MPEINFYLKSVKPDKKGLIPIIAQINLDYRKYRKVVEKTKEKYWNRKKQRVRPSKIYEEFNRHIEINSFLDDYEIKTRNFFTECFKQSIQIDEQIVKNYLAGRKVLRGKQLTFFEAFNLFIESQKSDKAERTITGYITILNFLKKFQKDMDIDIYFQNIDFVFFDQLKKYAFDYKNIQNNYFAKIISVLKTFLNWAENRNYIIDTTYKKFSFSEQELAIIYLTIDELLHLNKFEFSSTRHQKARDLYCFSCFTGLRYSDITQLKHEHINNNIILKKIQKTQRIETIPLNDLALEILERYKDLPLNALPKISSQKANKYIKEACEIVEINTPVIITENRGGKTKELIIPKFKLITMHTGRKTFVTNSLILGMNVKTIMGITGHKKDSTFNKYLKIADDYKTIEIENTWNKISKP